MMITNLPRNDAECPFFYNFCILFTQWQQQQEQQQQQLIYNFHTFSLMMHDHKQIFS